MHSVDKSITIKQHLDAPKYTVMGDPTQIQNAVLNLTLNARDAMPHGGDLIISTGTTELTQDYCKKQPYEVIPGNYLKVSITDTGIGMDKKIQSRIFEPFFTTKQVGKGTGMGLAAVYGSVKTHKGAINVYSEPEKGTTISLYFPLIEGNLVKPLQKIAKFIKGSGKVLLVDDEEIVIDMASVMLKDIGYKVVTKKDGVEALKYYRRYWKTVDIVLLDMVMPEMGGKETFAEMKKINPKVKCILSSGYSINGEAQTILDDGVLDFIQKPYNTVELSVMLNKLINE